MFILRSVVVLALVLACETAAARSQFLSSYNDMIKTADVVVIADATASADIKGSVDRDDGFAEVETVFRVDVAIKGELKEESFRFVHLRAVEPRALDIRNGPRLVTFDISDEFGKINLVHGLGGIHELKTKYMLFLKRRQDGSYEGITGVFDAAESVRQLAAPSEFQANIGIRKINP